MADSKKFNVTAAERNALRKLMLDTEKIAGDLAERFKDDLQAAVGEECCDFAHKIATGAAVTDNKLIALARASTAAWEFFYKMDQLVGDAEVREEEPVVPVPKDQMFDVTYSVDNLRYKTQLVVPLGESLYEALKSLSCPRVQFGRNEVSFKVEKVELDGMLIPNPLARDV